MTDTARLGIEFAEGQALWADVPFNDLLRNLDANMNLSVVSATTDAEPASPTNGDAYILPSGKSGTNWTAYTAGQIAYYSTTWTAFTAKPGTIARSADTGEIYLCTAANTWTAISSLLGTKGTDIASAGTTNIAAATGDYVHITGTTTITAFGTAKAGTERELVFDGALTLTHNATSLICITAANILTAAGDRARFRSLGSGNWRMMSYARADGTPLALTSADVTDALGYVPDYKFPVVTAMGNQTGSINVDLSLGKYYSMTLTGNVTIAFTNPPGAGFATDIVLIITQDGTGGRTVTITGAEYPSGIAYVATTTAGAEDHVGVRIRDAGSTIRAYPVENFG